MRVMGWLVMHEGSLMLMLLLMLLLLLLLTHGLLDVFLLHAHLVFQGVYFELGQFDEGGSEVGQTAVAAVGGGRGRAGRFLLDLCAHVFWVHGVDRISQDEVKIQEFFVRLIIRRDRWSGGPMVDARFG